MRLLTLGAKSTINTALAQHPDCELVALEFKPAVGPYQSILYDYHSKVSWRSVRQVRDVVRRHRPDLIHAFYPRPLAHAVLASLGSGQRVPIVSYRGITSVPKWWSPEEWFSHFSPRVAAHACESAAVRDALIAAGLDGNHCHVVHNCLTWPLDLHDRETARRELGLPTAATVAMMIARMRPVKGADLLIEAFSQCLDLPDLHLALVGRIEDPRVESLARDPRLSGRVHLLGFRPQASQWLAAADMFVMPSRAEALSVALLEAMSAGVCPVVSDAGGMKEAVRHEVDGLVFPRENVDALASALRKLVESPELARRYAASSRERAKSHFSANAVAERLRALYRSVLEK